MLPLQIHLTLPPWIGEVADESRAYVTDEERVGLAIALSKHNIESGQGGPFGAAVFNDAGRLISVGVNRVVPQTCSVAHAEMMPYMTAQQRMSTFGSTNRVAATRWPPARSRAASATAPPSGPA